MSVRNLARVFTTHCAEISMRYASHTKGTTLTAENRSVNKHCAVEIKLSCLTTSDCPLLTRLWLSPAPICCNGKKGRASIPAIAMVELGQLLRASPYPV